MNAVLPPARAPQGHPLGDAQLLPADASRAPKLSVIIPTLGRPDYLWSTVRQLLRQSFADFEIFVIDQSESAEADLAAQRFIVGCPDPRVRYVRLSTKGSPNAKNEGIALARAEILLFLDDDVILLSRDFLAAHIACYDNPAVGGVGGRVVERRIVPNARRTLSYITWGGRTVENLLGTRPCRLRSVKGANMSFRACVFRQTGGFDRRYAGNALLEEADVSSRVVAAGWTLMFEPRAELLHLSASGGGQRRVGGAEASEWFRFRNTGYYVVKHRGFLGLLPFSATFAAIAASRAWRWRSPSALLTLARAAREGVAAAALGSDDAIPYETHVHPSAIDRMRSEAPAGPLPVLNASEAESAATIQQATAPRVTLVLMARTHPDHALETTRQILDQSFSDFELLVLHQSDEASAEHLRLQLDQLGDSRVCFLHLLPLGVAYARNEGLKQRRGQIVLFLEEDVIFLGRDFIESHVRAFDDPSVGGVAGRTVERRQAPRLGTALTRGFFGYPAVGELNGTEPGAVEVVTGTNISIRADILEQIGGFDRRLSGAQDLADADMSTRIRRAGWKLRFEPRAEVLHVEASAKPRYAQSRLREECRRLYASAYYIGKHRDIIGWPKVLANLAALRLRLAWRRRRLRTLKSLIDGLRTGRSALRNNPVGILSRFLA
jgi:GT2 family glycosyltransferase